MASSLQWSLILLHLLFSAESLPDLIGSEKFSQYYELLGSTTTSIGGPVTKYRSTRTGIHLIFAHVEGPLVSGGFALATEANSHDGLPHTLEHLVFLGSEDYPHKGVLDLLATRSMADGTNAWTATDYTVYTLKTAGSEGFLNFLPIYVEHLLYPTLTENAFITEIYHIDGEGEDGGVVYSEMQGIENDDDSIVYETLRRALYPEPSGYHYETGGIMRNLRESTNNEKVIAYHKKFYRPENLHIIVMGQFDHQAVFAALESIEQKILKKGERSPYIRPWQTPPRPLSESSDIKAVFPSDSEDAGLLMIGWRGPSVVYEFKKFMQLSVLFGFLTHSSVSPLPEVFVEVGDPLASRVSYYVAEYSSTSCMFEFDGVPNGKIDEIKPLLLLTLNMLVNGSSEFDLELMNDYIRNLVLTEDSMMESDPYDTLTRYIVLDVLYGNSNDDLAAYLNRKAIYAELLSKPVAFWLSLIKTHMLDSPLVTVQGIPSIARADELQDEADQRIQRRKDELGLEGLGLLQERLDAAETANKVPPPSSILSSLPVPGIQGIHFLSLKSYSNYNEKADHRELKLRKLNFNLHFDDINSNFVRVVMLFDTSGIPSYLRSFIPLMQELYFECSLQRNGYLMPYEEVVKEFASNTISRKKVVGINLEGQNFKPGRFSHNLVLSLKMEPSKYADAVNLLYSSIYDIKFDIDRIHVKANKLLNFIIQAKRDGDKILRMMANDLLFDKDANINHINILRQEKVLTDLLERLDSNPDSVLAEINELHHLLTNITRVTFHIAGKLETMLKDGDPLDSLYQFSHHVPGSSFHGNLNVVPESNLKSQDDLGNITGFATGLGSIESSYLSQTTSSISDYLHPDFAALSTAVQYLTQLEGPLWEEIRGSGLAYNYYMHLNPPAGTLSFALSYSVQLTEAYTEAMRIFKSHLHDSQKWDPLLFASAKSSLMYSIIKEEALPSSLFEQSVLSYFTKVPQTFHKNLLKKISSVEMDDVIKAAKLYFSPLIDPTQSVTAIVCPPNLLPEIVDEMSLHGHNIQMVDDVEQSRFSSA